MTSFVGSSGNHIAAVEVGPEDGPLVLFLHGGGQTRHTWKEAQKKLAGLGYRSIAFDARGHGESSWTPDDGYSLKMFAADLLAILKTLKQPIAIVGASLGGLTALLALSMDPRLDARAIILVDVVPRPNDEGVEQIIEFMGAHQDGFGSLDEAAQAVTAYRGERPRSNSAKGLRKNLREAANGRYYWHWDPRFMSFRNDVAEFRDAMDAVLINPKMPVLLVRGGSSDVVTDDEVNAFRQLSPAATVVDIRDAGHMVVGDQNDVFTDAISTFINQQSRLKV